MFVITSIFCTNETYNESNDCTEIAVQANSQYYMDQRNEVLKISLGIGFIILALDLPSEIVMIW